ncbi:Basic protein [Methyloversatilis universalis FAM5]|uniref:Basic protein n=1 Tax=Methyloversatilis universalis (strain ATCC BAA-1314 / DSM 25237 / JCM 13912 / CCUG 52030 / FAM5) TaxID=1000565 RepID=F5RH86_METUF|nr:Basic protein [Methyloversatilis universalis FAM5]
MNASGGRRPATRVTRHRGRRRTGSQEAEQALRRNIGTPAWRDRHRSGGGTGNGYDQIPAQQ